MNLFHNGFNLKVPTDGGGSALNGFNDVAFNNACRFGSFDHGSDRSLVPKSSCGFKLPILKVSNNFNISGVLCC